MKTVHVIWHRVPTAYTHLDNARKLQDIILCCINDDPDSLKRAQENYHT